MIGRWRASTTLGAKKRAVAARCASGDRARRYPARSVAILAAAPSGNARAVMGTIELLDWWLREEPERDPAEVAALLDRLVIGRLADGASS